MPAIPASFKDLPPNKIALLVLQAEAMSAGASSVQAIGTSKALIEQLNASKGTRELQYTNSMKTAHPKLSLEQAEYTGSLQAFDNQYDTDKASYADLAGQASYIYRTSFRLEGSSKIAARKQATWIKENTGLYHGKVMMRPPKNVYNAHNTEVVDMAFQAELELRAIEAKKHGVIIPEGAELTMVFAADFSNPNDEYGNLMPLYKPAYFDPDTGARVMLTSSFSNDSITFTQKQMNDVIVEYSKAINPKAYDKMTKEEVLAVLDANVESSKEKKALLDSTLSNYKAGLIGSRAMASRVMGIEGVSALSGFVEDAKSEAIDFIESVSSSPDIMATDIDDIKRFISGEKSTKIKTKPIDKKKVMRDIIAKYHKYDQE